MTKEVIVVKSDVNHDPHDTQKLIMIGYPERVCPHLRPAGLCAAGTLVPRPSFAKKFGGKDFICEKPSNSFAQETCSAYPRGHPESIKVTTIPRLAKRKGNVPITNTIKCAHLGTAGLCKNRSKETPDEADEILGIRLCGVKDSKRLQGTCSGFPRNHGKNVVVSK